MRTGRPIAPLSVTGEERDRLQEWARRPKTAQAMAQRALIVLECAVGLTNTVVAGKLGITHQTVGKWPALPGAAAGSVAGRAGPGRRVKLVTLKLSGWRD